ncbi:ubiquitin-binding protein cue5 [Elasticomyces elasticus]|nr:ubiquitin-binding protein cue5 [Elasticomyces elasticus]
MPPQTLPTFFHHDQYCPTIPSDRGEDRRLQPPFTLAVYRLRVLHPSSAAKEQLKLLRTMADPPVSPIRETAHLEEAEHGDTTMRPVSPLPAVASPKPKVSFQEPPADDTPPQKPPRPQSPQQQAEHTLIEAFPSIDAKVVKAVLQASGGKVEPAFNALLGMSDPDFQADEPPPPQPPRPIQRQQPQSQLEADEAYARQLAEQYSTTAHHNDPHTEQPKSRGQAQYNQRVPARRGPNQQRPNHEYEYDNEQMGQRKDEQERSFLDDDLPEIGKTIQQGFVETQKRVNGWISTFKKRLDGDEDEDEDLYNSSQPGSRQNTYGGGQDSGRGGRQNFGSSQSEQLRGIRKAAEAAQAREAPRRSVDAGGRRSTEAGRYDADPHELDPDEFERLELRDDEPPVMPPRTSSRKANPDLFKSTPKPPQSGPVDEVDAFDRTRDGLDNAGGKGGTGRKWQPLTSTAPVPVGEEDDPFSLGDDDEEKEEVRKEDSDRLKKQASNSISAGSGEGVGVAGDGEEKKVLGESERKGSINVEAAELLAGAAKKE